MSKKSKSFAEDFTDNPAIPFITTPQEPQEPQEQTTAETPSKTTEPAREAPQRPTMRFVYAEKKTQRVQLVMQPSVLERTRAAAESLNISLNEYINQAIIQRLDREENSK